jgi:D-tyrosyl-tRNA(Tyr) deacylase
MRCVIQRVSSASVDVDKRCVGSIDKGILVLLGVHQDDSDKELQWMIDKLIHCRIFNDNEGKMNLSVKDIKGDILVVSQFTLYGDCKKGRRPSYVEAASPEKAKLMYDNFLNSLHQCYQEGNISSGEFRASMQVSLINDGPVTLVLDSN